jgi:hypothetical protein
MAEDEEVLPVLADASPVEWWDILLGIVKAVST